MYFVGNNGVGSLYLPWEAYVIDFSGESPWLPGHNVFPSSQETDFLWQWSVQASLYFFVWSLNSQGSMKAWQELDINLVSPVWLAHFTASWLPQLYWFLQLPLYSVSDTSIKCLIARNKIVSVVLGPLQPDLILLLSAVPGDVGLVSVGSFKYINSHLEKSCTKIVEWST